jgi:hypothetical protein
MGTAAPISAKIPITGGTIHPQSRLEWTLIHVTGTEKAAKFGRGLQQ